MFSLIPGSGDLDGHCLSAGVYAGGSACFSFAGGGQPPERRWENNRFCPSVAKNGKSKILLAPRPSADDYGTVASGASNLGPSSAALKKAIDDFATKIRATYKLATDTPLPDDLITTSASGLDPHISPEAARLQIERVAEARGFTDEQKHKLASLVESHIEGPQLGFLGNARVNVLLLNLDLDKL